jgi:hypothetical protein
MFFKMKYVDSVEYKYCNIYILQVLSLYTKP